MKIFKQLIAWMCVGGLIAFLAEFLMGRVTVEVALWSLIQASYLLVYIINIRLETIDNEDHSK